ncbi:hypothetical protein B0H11DRAFT_1917045 [Mycena galericulata]|nr:hypothetical protein B0H11DRAFT_1917045 [Mycena galericulata]
MFNKNQVNDRLRDKHKVDTVGDAEIETRKTKTARRTHRKDCKCEACKEARTTLCFAKARKMLMSLEPKWDPLFPHPEDYEAENTRINAADTQENADTKMEPEPDEPITVFTDGSGMDNGKDKPQAGSGICFGEGDNGNRAIKIPDTLDPSNQGAMAEPWAYTSSLDTVDPESNDPDRPISGRLRKHSRKPARAGLAMILYVRSKVCLRDLIRKYLGDKSRDHVTWCCDLDHPDDPKRKFDKRTFFPGRFIYADADGGIYAGDVDEADRVHLNPPKGKKRRSKGLANRRVIDRSDLQCRLRTWLVSAHASNPLRAVRPAAFILDTQAIKALSTVHPDRIISVLQVVMAAQETEEWGEPTS